MLPSIIPTRFLDSMVEIVAAAPVGCFIEVGVYRGGSAQRLYEITELQGRSLHLFDTFAGIPVQNAFDTHVIGDFNASDYEEAIRTAMPNAVIHKGIFPETLPLRWRGAVFADIAFVHADGDQFQTTLDVLRCFYPRLVPGGMIIFDDYGTPMCHGCTKAVDEYVAEQRLEVSFDPIGGGGRAILRRAPPVLLPQDQAT